MAVFDVCCLTTDLVTGVVSRATSLLRVPANQIELRNLTPLQSAMADVSARIAALSADDKLVRLPPHRVGYWVPL